MTSKIPDIESQLDLDALDTSSHWRTADGVEETAATLKAFMQRYERDQVSQRRRDVIEHRWTVAGVIAALIAAAAALYPIVSQYVCK